jgi:hypothetical protein
MSLEPYVDALMDNDYYPQTGDWVKTTIDIEETFFFLKAGAVGRLVREEKDEVAMKHSQSAHDLILYIVDFAGVEVRCHFLDVVKLNLLDQVVREVDRA